MKINEDMVLFAQSHEDFIKEVAELPSGIPSHDPFNHYLLYAVAQVDICSVNRIRCCWRCLDGDLCF